VVSIVRGSKKIIRFSALNGKTNPTKGGWLIFITGFSGALLLSIKSG
jgi:hypothetical protein